MNGVILVQLIPDDLTEMLFVELLLYLGPLNQSRPI